MTTAYYDVLRARGVSHAEAMRLVEQLDREGADLDAMRCPDCKSETTLTKNVDPNRQAGFSGIHPHGVWVQYRCSCGFMVDRKEPLS